MDREELIKIIEIKLENFGMPPFSKLKDNIQEYLVKIEIEIQSIYSERKESIEKYKANRINILSIAKKAGIARQTIYNNREVIETYIQKNQIELEAEDVFNSLQEKNETIADLSEIIRKLNYRDLTEQLYLDRIDFLEKENKNLVNQMMSLNEKNIMLRKNLEELKKHVPGNQNSKKVMNLQENTK